MDEQALERPAWARRILAERQARKWSQADLVRALRAHAANPDPGHEAVQLPSDDAVRRRLIDWEKGKHRPDDFYQGLIAKTFGTASKAFFPPDERNADSLLSPVGLDTLSIVSRLQRSDVNSATLDGLKIMVDKLCCEYPYMPSATLLIEGRDLLNKIVEMLHSSRLTIPQHTEAKVLAGWLCLLVGCVEYDMGDRQAAEATRRAAMSLAHEAGHAEILGWAHEMRAWFALTTGDYRGVIAAAQAGSSVAGSHSVNVQLVAQEAKAWARVGDRRQLEVALDRGRRQLETMPYPESPDHHFIVDPAKFDFYAMDCYRLIGENELARTYAEEVIRMGTDFDGHERSVMRNSEARITLGVVAARDGDLDAALSYGNSALDGDRKSLPSLLMVSRELSQALNETGYSEHPSTVEYIDRLRSLRAS